MHAAATTSLSPLLPITEAAASPAMGPRPPELDSLPDPTMPTLDPRPSAAERNTGLSDTNPPTDGIAGTLNTTGEYTEAKSCLKMEDVHGVDCNVDIIGSDDGGSSSKLAIAEDPDATECSSSFGDTVSGSEDGAKPSETSDIEVDSPFYRSHPNGDSATLLDAAPSDIVDILLKKKKVTDHWRSYIRPVMWRCQWLELRMKDLQSQVSRYDRELAALRHEKELRTKMIELDCSSSRSVPFSSRCCRKIMKRRRRKRHEEKINASSYISTHPVLSYFEKEKTEADGHSIDGNGNLDESTKGNNDSHWLFGNGGNTIEQIVSRIQSVQDRVLSLRSNLKNAMANTITLQISTGVNGESSNCKRGKGKVGKMLEISPPDASDCDMDDTDLPDSAVSSYGEANNMDIFESTMSLLSAEDPHKMGELHQSSEDVLIDNQAAEEGYQNFEVISHPCKRLRISVKRETSAHSGDESAVAPIIDTIQREVQEEGTTSFNLLGTLKPYTGKRNGRKPKIQRRGGGGGLSSSALSSWRSSRIRKKKKF